MHFLARHRPVLLALLISVICGFGGNAIGMPLPWMLGPMIGNTIAALAGVSIKGPSKARPVVVPIIGVMLGSAITVELFADLAPWIATLVALPVVLGVSAGVSFAIYRRIGGYDTITAYYAAMPGGLTEMVLFGEAAGGDDKKIALAHTSRILLVILCVVAFFWLVAGVRTTGTGQWTAFDALTLWDYGVLGLCAVVGFFAGRALNLPAAPFFGPMVLSGGVHLAGWVTVPPPSVLVIVAQIVMGTIIGARFVGATLGEIKGDLVLGLISAIAMLLVAVICAELLVLTGLPLAQAFLAFAPGGLTEMSLLALSMEQDPAYVSTIHLIRITLVIAAAPVVFGMLRRFSSR